LHQISKTPPPRRLAPPCDLHPMLIPG